MNAPLLNTEATTTRRPRRPSFREYVGSGFICGSVVGSAYHLPTGGFQAVWTKVPPLSCNSAVLFGAMAAIHRAMVSARGKEDRVQNAAVAAAGAVGIANIPKGVPTAACAALVYGALGGAMQAGLDKLLRQQPDDPAPAPDEYPGTPPARWEKWS